MIPLDQIMVWFDQNETTIIFIAEIVIDYVIVSKNIIIDLYIIMSLVLLLILLDLTMLLLDPSRRILSMQPET